MLTHESLIEWASCWVPDDQRERFVEGLQRETDALKRRAFADGYAFGLEHGSDNLGDKEEEAWRAYTSTELPGEGASK